MTHREIWLTAVALGLVLSDTSAPALRAQQPGPERPAPAPLRVEALDPQLESILRDWERESAKIKVLQGEHYRQEFNSVFSVEKRSKGMFYFEAPDKGRFDMRGAEIKPGQKAQKIDPQTQKPYNLAAGSDQSWICTGQEVLMIDPAAKTFETFPIPPEMQGQNIVQSPLPFLFGMKAADAQRRFKLKFYGQNDDAYFIDAEPRQQADAQNYKNARIVLDKTTFVPTKVYLLDPAGTLMTEYTFVNTVVNPKQNVVAQLIPFFKDPDPFKPNLRGYKQVLPPVVQPVGDQRLEPLPPQNRPLRGALR